MYDDVTYDEMCDDERYGDVMCDDDVMRNDDVMYDDDISVMMM